MPLGLRRDATWLIVPAADGHREEFTMGKAEPLKDLLRRKKKEGGERDRTVEKEAWLAAIDALYSDVERWLKPSISDGVAKVQRRQVTMTERHLGTYRAEELVIDAGGSKVRFKPVALHVVGATGRVDILGADDSVRLMRLGPERGWCASLGPGEPYLFPFTKEEFTAILERLL